MCAFCIYLYIYICMHGHACVYAYCIRNFIYIYIYMCVTSIAAIVAR